MRSAIVKRSVSLRGHKTSFSLEEAFWVGLRDIAGRENTSLRNLVEQIDRNRTTLNLSSAVRTFVFKYVRVRLQASLSSADNILERCLNEKKMGLEQVAGAGLHQAPD